MTPESIVFIVLLAVLFVFVTGMSITDLERRVLILEADMKERMAARRQK